MAEAAALPLDTGAAPDPGEAPALDVDRFVRDASGGVRRLDLMVDGIHCGACVQRIERALRRRPEVVSARVNLSTRRLTVTWRGRPGFGSTLAAAVAGLGFTPTPYDPVRMGEGERREETELLRALGVAGFAAGNVMLLSVSIWAGHSQGMGPETRALLHWFSALIALPAVAYAGLPFFRSALSALAHGRTNMDVPISIGVVLASAVSLSETLQGGVHAYFDSAITLLFFLLVGRYLDRRARGRARQAAERLLALDVQAATVLAPDGSRRVVPAEELAPGMVLLVAAGERIPADAKVARGRSSVDQSLISGESVPLAVGPDERVFAGTINVEGPLELEVLATGDGTLLAEIVRLLEAAEQRRARYVALADRVARFYAPAVHLTALLTFLGWLAIGGLAWQPALLIAVAVLIVTCPCALGLAVPAVQVIASGRLMRRGVLLKSATALERLAAVDTVVFDKTGTLTEGRPVLVPDPAIAPEDLRLAARIAATSRHPLARALARALPEVPPADGVREVPGAGLALATAAGEVRLGSREWCGAGVPDGESDGRGELEIWLARPNALPVRFAFTDRLRADAAETVGALQAAGYAVELLSGDRESAVEAVARTLGIERWRAGAKPADKIARLEALAAEGRHVLMVGDGLNDAPALAAACVSLSPSTAVDISRTAADAIFQGNRLAQVAEALRVARLAERLVRQNFGLAVAYNMLAVPLAVAGLVTPLIAAVAMSSSSLLVVGNALRLAAQPRAG